MAKKKWLHKILAILPSISLIVILLISSFEIGAYGDWNFYEKEYEKYKVADELYMEMPDIMKVTKFMMSYLRGNEKKLSIETEVEGNIQDFFNEKDRLHMADVQGLFLGGLAIRRGAIIVLLFSMAALVLMKADWKRLIPQMYQRVLAVFLALTAVAGFLFSRDFNKYFVIFTILMTVGGIVDNFKGGNVQYFYIKYLLGGENNWAMFTIYQVVTGVPLGIGAFVIYPLAKKFGIKNVSLVGYGLVLIGSIVGWLQPSNMIVAFVAGFIRQMGYLPNLYVTATLLCYAYDSVEQKSGLRLEGLLGVAIITAVQTAIYAPFAGGYEAAILKLGFVDVAGVTPSAEVTSFMATAFYLFDIILATAYIVLLPFMDVEKKLPEINAELLERKKAATLARGEEWIDPAELESREAEENARIHEENRIADLKEHCAKKGLDFDVENAKYLAKQAKKQKVKK